MIGHQDRWQEDLFHVGSLESLIPGDHILRRVDLVLDLSWLPREVAPLYSETNGRPSIDPEAAVRLMLAGLFAGITSDRKLMREAQVNLAMRWFAGWRLHETLPDHSSLTRLRQRWGADLFEKIFERTVAQCARAGLIESEVVHIDATLIRADADARRVAREHARRVREANACEDDDQGPDERPDPPPSGGRGPDREATLSTSSGRMVPQPSYKQHQAVDAKHGVIVDVEVTTGVVAESSRLVDQVDRAAGRLGQMPRVVTADSGYSKAAVFAALEERGVEPLIVPRPEPRTARRLPQRAFHYDAHHDVVRCPEGKTLRPIAAHRNGWNYRSLARDCRPCPRRARCVDSKAGRRIVKLSAGHDALLRGRRRHARRDPADKALHTCHRILAEGRHAEAKRWHGLGRAARRSVCEVKIQSLMTAAVLNLKRLAAAAANRWCAFYPFRPLDLRCAA